MGSEHGPHAFIEGEWGGCEVCMASYHCAKCEDASGSQGHYVGDDDGWYFSCQEPERWQRQINRPPPLTKRIDEALRRRVGAGGGSTRFLIGGDARSLLTEARDALEARDG